MRARPVGLVLVAVAVTAACGGGDAPVSGAGDLDRLCDAQEVTVPDEFRELFEGPAHQALHDLADDLQAADLRPVAGDVLEAKQAVEAALAADPVPDDLSERLATLVGATSRGLAALGRPVLSCAD